MREAVLFYSFLGIFLVTAVLTLVGLVGLVTIPATQLNLLVGALIVELAGAVIALYRRTEFFKQPADNLATSLGSSVESFDRISDEIKATIEDQPVDPNRAHGFLIQRAGDSVVAYQRMQVISADELARLPKDQRDLIRTYERSMNALTKEWKAIKESGTSQIDPGTRKRMLELLRGAKDDLVGLLDFLQGQGLYLDDHYLEVRHLVSNL